MLWFACFPDYYSHVCLFCGQRVPNLFIYWMVNKSFWPELNFTAIQKSDASMFKQESEQSDCWATGEVTALGLWTLCVVARRSSSTVVGKTLQCWSPRDGSVLCTLRLWMSENCPGWHISQLSLVLPLGFRSRGPGVQAKYLLMIWFGMPVL